MFLLFREIGPTAPAEVTLSPEERRHLRARRMKNGAAVFVGDGAGRRWRAALDLQADCVRLEADRLEKRDEAPLRLFVAPPERNRQDWLLQKAAELGVTEIRWLRTERGQHRPIDPVRAARILSEAAAQSERFVLPRCCGETEWAALLARSADDSLANLKIALDPRARLSLATALGSRAGQGVDLAVGPEGGFSLDELGALERSGWRPGRLGDSVLRVETAAIAALAVVQAFRSY